MTVYKPCWKRKPKVWCPLVPHHHWCRLDPSKLQHPFLTHCTFMSSASEPQKQAMPLLSVSPLHGALAGYCCRLHYPPEEPAPQCQFGPGPTPVQTYFLTSSVALLWLAFYPFLSYTLGNVLFGAQSEKLV